MLLRNNKYVSHVLYIHVYSNFIQRDSSTYIFSLRSVYEFSIDLIIRETGSQLLDSMFHCAWNWRYWEQSLPQTHSFREEFSLHGRMKIELQEISLLRHQPSPFHIPEFIIVLGNRFAIYYEVRPYARRNFHHWNFRRIALEIREEVLYEEKILQIVVMRHTWKRYE